MTISTAERNARQAIIDTCLQMNAEGINQGTSGNVSQRWEAGFLISPSALPYHRTTPADIVFVDLAGDSVGKRKPSSEWRFHRDIYLHRPDIAAIVHTHSTYATALAIKGMEIPPLHYMVAAGGGHTIRCAPYATYGTQALSDNALKALEDRLCCLLANHGVIAAGPNLEKALWLAGEIEVVAQQYCITLQLGGPTLLSAAQMDEVLEKFKDYKPDVVE